jgi:hypothetical protein
MADPCQTCRWWHGPVQYASGHPWGECRRYPPQVVMTPSNSTKVEFPTTAGFQFCGEHQPKPKETK